MFTAFDDECSDILLLRWVCDDDDDDVVVVVLTQEWYSRNDDSKLTELTWRV